MKYIFSSFFILFSMLVIAQESNNNPPLKTTPSNGITKTYKVNPQPRVKLVKVNTSNAKPVKTVASITSYINAVQGKIDYINSDQSQREEAEQSGWFTEMNKNITQAKIERQLLIDKNNSND